jgi:hypothetical protein
MIARALLAVCATAALLCLDALVPSAKYANYAHAQRSASRVYASIKMNKVEWAETPASMTSGTTGDLMTLSRFMIEATRANPDHADFESLIQSIQIACKAISHKLSRQGVPNLSGKESSSSDSLYDTANTILQNSLRFTGKIGKIAMQNEQPILIEEAWNRYVPGPSLLWPACPCSALSTFPNPHPTPHNPYPITHNPHPTTHNPHPTTHTPHPYTASTSQSSIP